MLPKAKKSTLFTAYNKAMKAARQHKLDPVKVRKALGLVQHGKLDPKYSTTTKFCCCPDRQYHNSQPCKHMIAAMILQRMDEYANPYPLTQMSDGYAVAWQRFGGYSIIWVDSQETWNTVKAQYPAEQLVRPAEAHGKRLADYKHSWMLEELINKHSSERIIE